MLLFAKLAYLRLLTVDLLGHQCAFAIAFEEMFKHIHFDYSLPKSCGLAYFTDS